jgi:UDP-GlcNAc:undecaprenyl-phosphate GlcNAc-1-phosphate transferase
LVGCCVGFLPHNFHPARLFMGDAGALLLGLLLAAATISMTGNIDPSAQVGGNATAAILLPVFLPLAILSLPLLDVLLAVVRRTRAGRRPWHPDAQHLHHRMLQIGHTHVRAVLLLYLWAAVVALGAVSFAYVDGWMPFVVIAVAAVSAMVLTIWLPRWRPQHRLR